MSAIYDNWERLVAAVVKKQQLWQLFHEQSRSPSILSEDSDSDLSFNLGDLGYEYSNTRSSFEWGKSRPKLVLVSDFITGFDIKDVTGASLELLGRGTFGSAYAATTDNGARIVVKRIRSSMDVSEVDFRRHMAIVGDVRHENVVGLRAYYSSEDQRLMLYDYCTNGSVYSLLHGQRDDSQVNVDWETRLKIAMGVARGIAEIHAQLNGTLVHGNIKASNVFLNRQSYGCVSDLGMTSMIKTTFDSTSRCYAPEVQDTRNVSHASDVYGFGILLLELLTRKSSVNVPGGPVAFDLVKLINSIKSKERAAKVFDADLLKHPSIREQMVKLLHIGIQCVAKAIIKRPKMFEVVKMLEVIFTLNTIIPYSLQKRLDFFVDASPAFDLEDLLKASAEVLGKGTFGTCYLTRLENGNTVVVKRLKNATMPSKDFQQQMLVLGTMMHKNIAPLCAYYSSTDEILLVYDYYDQGSVYALLHGTPRMHLDWETRLKIAVGSAKGIAHIHSKDGQKLVHGNIKSSNIFLNGQNYGIVSDAGLASLTNYIGWPNSSLSRGYIAPERNASQPCDVYSFGVVLLELVCGRPSQLTSDDGDVISLVKWVQAAVIDNMGIDRMFDVKCLRYENVEVMQRVFRVAWDCVSMAPEQRPTMGQVVQVLEKISGTYKTTTSELQFHYNSLLECLLEDLLPMLT